MPVFRLRDHPLQVWGVATVIAGAAIGIAFTVLGYTPADFEVARACFWIAAGIIMFATIVTLLGVTWPFWQRAPIAGVIGGNGADTHAAGEEPS